MKRCTVSIAAVATLALALATPAVSSPPTTVDQTIGDFNGDNRLDTGPGDPYVVRAELGDANPNRERTRKRLYTLGQITDLQTVDEESPMRLEGIDDVGLGDDALGGAYRPQEALGIFDLNAMVKTLNKVRSPVSGRRLQLAIITGDNADNMQQNETEWYRDVLDGKRSLNPNSGDPDYDPGWLCFPPYPDDIYQGVRGNEWYEPNGSGDGPGYSSIESENWATKGRHVAVRDFPELLEKAQQPFRAKGLRFPWLTVFGNHDGLVQGTVPKNGAFEDLATGCYKDLDGNGIPTDEVQPDPKRHLLDHDEWIAEHFLSPGNPGPVGHGFDESHPNQGYYSKKLRRGLRLIALDSVNPDGIHDGIIDDVQFNWLDAELTLANQRDEKVIVVAHHSLRTMRNTDIFGYEGQHCGLIDQGWTWGVPCETIGEESLEALFYRQGNVIAYIAGHEHVNNIVPRQEESGPGRFWEITTASEIDWPQQSGMIEIYDNRDGTYSIFRTMIDHAAPVDPGDNPNLDNPNRLASISREISFNDYQGKTGEDGTEDHRGDPEDRNVELMLDVTP